MTGKVATVVLAAGAATRFGGRKQLALLDGRPLLEHALAIAAAGGTDLTVVVLGAYAEEIEAAVDSASRRARPRPTGSSAAPPPCAPASRRCPPTSRRR